MKNRILPFVIVVVCGLLTVSDSARAQGAAFTYQGQLSDGTNPANGSYDISFALYSATSGGLAIAGPVTNSAVSVSNGLFSTVVNFSGAPFNGASNWLELAIRTNGTSSFSPPLAPRQQLTPTPYAVYAESANAGGLIGTLSGNGSGLTNLPASQLTSGAVPDARLSGNVALLDASQTFTGFNNFNTSLGIGTSNPQYRLHIVGNGSSDNARLMVETTGGTLGPQLRLNRSGSGGEEWVLVNDAAANGPLNAFQIVQSSVGTRLLIDPSGNVGLGTQTPDRRLTIVATGTNGEWISLKDTNGATKWHINNQSGGLNVAQSGIADNRLFLRTNGYVGLGTAKPQLPLDVLSLNYAVPAAQFAVANCGLVCGQTNYQEGIRLWNQNSNGQIGLGFLVSAGSFNSNAFPNVWIGTDYNGSGRGNDFMISTLTGTSTLTDRIHVQGSTGNVGIGTTTPGRKLDVAGDFAAASSIRLDSAGTGDGSLGTALLFGSNGSGEGIASKRTAGTGQFGINFYTASASRMTVANNGNVGIGTTTPTTEKLVVSGGVDVTSAASSPSNDSGLGISYESYGGRLQSFGNKPLVLNPIANNVGVGTTTPTHGRLEVGGNAGTYHFPVGSVALTFGFSFPSYLTEGDYGSAIFANGGITANGDISTVSDARIKNILDHSDAALDLDTLQKIEITDFRYKDVIAHGNRISKKVIAQQVEKVFPQAVTQQRGEVPDIYQPANIKDGWIQLATNLKKGERVKLIADQAEGVYEVLEASTNKFRTNFKSTSDYVFVFGREVKDFRTVDYDAIAMLNVSATQELARRLADQTKQNAELKARLETLEARETQFTALEKEMAGLKKLVAEMALETKSTKQASHTSSPARPVKGATHLVTTASLIQ